MQRKGLMVITLCALYYITELRYCNIFVDKYAGVTIFGLHNYRIKAYWIDEGRCKV